MKQKITMLCFVLLFLGISNKAESQEPYLGEIRLFAGNFAPRGWAFCHGQLLAISQNDALFSILGTIYGGDGRTTFALPDLRGRVPLQHGQGPGLTNFPIGAKGGTQTNTLIVGQLPSHNHEVKIGVNTSLGDQSDPTGVLASHSGGFAENFSGFKSLEGTSILAQGGNQPVNNIQPYISLNYIICLQGVYPSRN